MIRRVHHWLLRLGIAALTLAGPGSVLDASEKPGSPEPDSVATHLVPLLNRYCTNCHNAADPKSGLDLTPFRDELSVLKQRQTWQNIERMIRAGEMPPTDKPRPTADERDKLLTLIDSVINQVDCNAKHDPGRVTIRRLNRLEYNNTVRDLAGVQLSLAEDFPADDIGYGFDHIGDVLSLPTVLFEKYLQAAEKIVDAALREGEITNGPIRRFLSREMKWSGPGDAPEQGKYGRVLALGGELSAEMEAAENAEYIANVRALSIPKVRQPFKLELRIDGQSVKVVEYSEMQTRTIPVRISIPRGRHTISVAVVVEGADPVPSNRPRREGAENERRSEEGRAPRLNFEYIDLQGPIDPSPTLSEQLILVRRPSPDGRDEAECVNLILNEFARRAFRRPVTNDDTQTYLNLYRQRRDAGDDMIRGLKVAISAVLISPQFLFRIERDTGTNHADGVRDLNDFELASRLSYFLWSSMPDEELFELAEQRRLKDPAVLRSQVKRMLADHRRQTFVENFCGQWLQLRNLDILNPDRGQFPDFDSALRVSMRRETELFFESLIHEDRSLLELLDADYTFANDRLARHYGLPASGTAGFQKVNLPDDRRGGVLTHGSILTVTSNPTRTSPVKRGKWILENILGTPAPPPPPMVEPLDESATAVATGSLRERMELHRSKPGCASCHQRMDPLGFGFENFDAIGRWRTEDAGFPIDSSGDLPSGESFKTPREFRKVLVAHRDEFARCLTEKMLTYALGRGLEYYDKCTVDIIEIALKSNDYRFSVLIESIVSSEPFQRKRVTKEEP